MTTITVDRAGRILIPKSLRQKLRVGPGDELQVSSEGERITLRPVRAKALLKKEQGVWVYQGEPTSSSIPDLIDRVRSERIAEVISGPSPAESRATDILEELKASLSRAKRNNATQHSPETVDSHKSERRSTRR